MKSSCNGLCTKFIVFVVLWRIDVAFSAFAPPLFHSNAIGHALSHHQTKTNASITDTDWTAMNSQGVAGIDMLTSYTAVHMVIFSKGCLYLGGAFNAVEEINALNIAKWDGRKWTALGAGIAGSMLRNTSNAYINNRTIVDALAADDSGNIYAGGSFDSAGGVAASLIAKWDGKSWSNLGSGITLTFSTDCIAALALDSHHTIYAAGTFSMAGGVPASNIAKWDGKKWEAMGRGISAAVFTGTPVVSSIAFDTKGNLYAAGQFDTAGGIPAKCLAVWDGAQWKSFAGMETSSSVNAMVIDRNNAIYLTGGYLSSGFSSRCRIAKWNGSAWDSLGTGLNEPAWALMCDSNDNLLAAGPFTIAGGDSVYSIAQWNGVSWTGFPQKLNGSIYSMACDNSGNLYVGGRVLKPANRVTIHGIAVWNGQQWRQPGTGSDGIVLNIINGEKGEVFICGDFTVIGGKSLNHIARWNKTGWQDLGSGTNGTVAVMAYDAKGNLYAAGNFDSAGGVSARHIARWDGMTWHALGSGTLQKVNGLACDKNGLLYAGGAFDTMGGIVVSHVAQWDGAVWHPLGSGYLKMGIVQTLAIDGSGYLYTLENVCTGDVCGLAMKRWRGTELDLSLSTKGDILENNLNITPLVVDQTGTLYLGKSYGANQNAIIVQWDGSAWKPFGNCGKWGLLSLAFADDGALYAGGRIDSTDYGAAHNIVRFDQTQWTALGSGTDGIVHSVAVDDSTLFVGGYFNNAGNVYSPYIARVNIHCKPNLIDDASVSRIVFQPISVRCVKSILVFSHVLSTDRIVLRSLDGRSLHEAKGVATIAMQHFAAHVLTITVHRNGNVVFKTIVAVP